MIQPEVRILNSPNRQELSSLIENDEEKNTIDRIDSQIFQKVKNQFSAVGLYSGDRIIGMSVMVFDELRPWSSLVYMKIHSQVPTAQRLAGLVALVDYTFKISEERNCVRVYMLNKLQRRERHLNARLYPLAKKVDRLRKYTFISESVIKAGEKPHYDFEYRMMGLRTHPEDVGIVTATRICHEF